jgi:hypothetical protein
MKRLQRGNDRDIFMTSFACDEEFKETVYLLCCDGELEYDYFVLLQNGMIIIPENTLNVCQNFDLILSIIIISGLSRY